MAIRFLLDEHFRGPVWRALLRLGTTGGNALDVVRVGDADALPCGTSDPDLLAWAEENGRILVTADKATMIGHFQKHLQRGRHSPGLFLVSSQASIRQVASFLEAVAYASEPAEWVDQMEFIP
ncbi:MAG: DUF5615 family PIN-like protein [Tepidisphaerales bacterium]